MNHILKIKQNPDLLHLSKSKQNSTLVVNKGFDILSDKHTLHVSSMANS